MGVSVVGTRAAGVRRAVESALERHGCEVTGADVSAGDTAGLVEAAKRDKLAALLVGQVQSAGKRLRVRVYAADGALVDEASWTGPSERKLELAVGRTLWARVGGAIAKARAPSEKAEQAPAPRANEETGAPEAPEPPRRRERRRAQAEEGEAPRPTTEPAATALDLGVGPRFVSRHYTWSPTVPALPAYSLGFAPSIGASLAWYPAAHARRGWAANLGVAAALEITPGLTSQTADGTSFPTSESDFWAGLRGRVVFGVAQASLTLAGGQQKFAVSVSDPAMRYLPDVKYTYGRAGVDLRLALPADVSLVLGAGYRYVFAGGTTPGLVQSSAYFPDSTFLAFDAMAAAGYRLLSVLEARAGFDVRRYQMTAGANTYMVSSATDQYLAFWFELALTLPGYAGGEAPRAAAPARSSGSEGEGEGEEEGGAADQKKKADDDEE